MTFKKLYIFFLIGIFLQMGFPSRATTIVPQIMLLLNGENNQQEVKTARYDEVRLDIAILE